MQSYPKLRANKSKGQDRLAKALFRLLNKTILYYVCLIIHLLEIITMIFLTKNKKEL